MRTRSVLGPGIVQVPRLQPLLRLGGERRGEESIDMVSTFGVREQTSSRRASTMSARVAGAVLALAVAAIHVIDQGGIPGQKDPAYVGVGYYLLEAAGVVVAVALLASREG